MITIKTSEEIEIMAEAGKRLAEILQILANEIVIGMETNALDIRAQELCKKMRMKPAFLGYTPSGTTIPFPSALCVSVNEIIVHGLPSKYIVQDGDLVTIDMGLLYEGFYVDSAITVGVGGINSEVKKLLKITQKSLNDGIAQAKAGNTIGDIGWAISNRVKKSGFSIVSSLIGHGIGKNLHEDPAVPNFGEKKAGETLVAGMCIAIEPMVAMGQGDIETRDDDSFATLDGSLSAHFEHTIAIAKHGPQILTKI